MVVLSVHTDACSIQSPEQPVSIPQSLSTST